MTSATTIAIVTGATKGLGAQISLALLSRGYGVIGVARHYPSDEHVARTISSGGLHFVQGDVSAEGTACEVFDAAEKLGTPTLLVNCAGTGIFGPVGSYSRADVDVVFSAGLVGTILFCEEAVRRYRSRGMTIVNVMSTAAQVGRANETVYCASKWGARGYTEALRTELKGTSNRVIGVFPGGMNTEFWKTRGTEQIDPSKFMEPHSVAGVVLDALTEHTGTYVSDIVINRG